MCRKAQRGFAMVTAIFILIVLAALGAFIATVSSNQQIGAALDVQGAQAYQAARAGVEWGLYQVIKGSAAACGSTGTEVDVSAAPSLAGMTVTVKCTQVSADEAGLGALYNVTSWACNTPGASTPKCPGNVGGLGYVERKITALAER
jgi:MSHA biogenesis protein MshP